MPNLLSRRLALTLPALLLPMTGRTKGRQARPEHAVRIVRVTERETDDRTLVEVLREARQMIERPEGWQADDYGSYDGRRQSLRGAIIQASRRGPLMSSAWTVLSPFYQWRKRSDRTHERDLLMLDRAIDLARFRSGESGRFGRPAQHGYYFNNEAEFVQWRNEAQGVEVLGFHHFPSFFSLVFWAEVERAQV